MNLRLAFIRTIAIALICLSPFAVWWMWQTSSSDIELHPELAQILGNPIKMPSKKRVNLYSTERIWTNQRGEAVNIASFKGKTAISTFIYTRCFKECVLSIIDLKRLDKTLTEKEKKEVQILLFSFDPENDTPEALKIYAEQFDVDLSRWSFLTADEDELEALAEEFGFYFKKQGDFFSHTVQVSVLKRDGTLQKQFYGNNLDPDRIAREVRSTL
ncbi:MAG: SCO family protein [Proteobacteria bacterium]|nr:SCO family protein [Pseudomonadota bacterium]